MKITQIDDYTFENEMSRLELYISRKGIENFIRDLTIEDVASCYLYMTAKEMVAKIKMIEDEVVKDEK